MKTSFKTFLVFLSLGTISTLGYAFADDTNIPSVSSASGQASYSQGWERGHGNEFFQPFLRTDLSDTEKTALETLKQNHRDAVSALFQANKSSLQDGAFQAQLKTLQDNFITALLPYIATDKVAAFNQFVANMKPMSGRGPGMVASGSVNFGSGTQYKFRPERMGSGEINDGSGRIHSGRPTRMNTWSGVNQPRNNENGTSPVRVNPQPKPTASATLSAQIAKLLDTKLATFADDATRLAWMSGVVGKINILESKTLSQNSKNILNALKNLINDRIDTINGNVVNQDTITNLLQ